MSPKCDWPEHKIHVNETLTRLEKKFDDFIREYKDDQQKRDDQYQQDRDEYSRRLTKVQIQETILRVKSGAWGTAGASFVLFLGWLKEHLKQYFHW